MADIAEQIRAFEEKRATLVAANEAIMNKAADSGSTLDAEQEEEFDGNQADIDAIDKHLKRLRDMEKAAAAGAKPVNGKSSEEGSDSREGKITVKAEPKLAPGIGFARMVKCLGMAQGVMSEAASIARQRYGDESKAFGLLKAFSERGERLNFAGTEKANVTGGSTQSGSWTENLILDEGGYFADFVEFLRPQTIIGQFGAGNIPALRSVPFRVALGSQTGGGSAYWTCEGKPKPLTSFDFAKTHLEPLKCANIAVLTEELIRDSSAASEILIRDGLASALIERIDTDFIDPTNAGTSGVKPASITHGTATMVSSGTDADAIRDDIRGLLQIFINANNKAAQAVLVMRSDTALALSMMVSTLDVPIFPNIGMNGGVLLGIPVITSEYVPSGIVVLVAASEVYFADNGGIAIDVSREASLQMLDNPTNDVVTPTATSLVSLWQTNSVGFRAERSLNWALRRTSGVAYISSVAWGGAVNVPS
jgi:HK97 family phage major capsid protein